MKLPLVAHTNSTASGWRLIIKGQVQGVGFRPFAYKIISQAGIQGQTYNSGSDAIVDVICTFDNLQFIKSEILKKLPTLARIDTLSEHQLTNKQVRELQLKTTDKTFIISESSAGETPALNITPDTAPCENCLNELFDNNNRRYLYPFINCTQCGPRYTIVDRLPYDRKNTSMAVFEQCSECSVEYNNPNSRRFHAQPNACEQCGPLLWHTINNDKAFDLQSTSTDSIQIILDIILRGGIVAVRSVGGFHLVCDGNNPQAIERLRQRKRRPTKPLAIMVANVASAQQWVELTPESKRLIAAQSAPIVISDVNTNDEKIMSALAPGLNRLGVMLAQSPIHWLLFYYYLNKPNNKEWRQDKCSLTLVMTSANVSGEPLITDNNEAEAKLINIADAFLFHDRDIVTRCDDSVFSSWTNHLLPLRLGRGYSPLTFTLPPSIVNSREFSKGHTKSILALGSYLKNTVALNSGFDVCLSQHGGDLNHPDNCHQLDITVNRLLDLMKVKPDAIACDLHPEGYGRQLAERLCDKFQVPLIEVPHHVAHVYASLSDIQTNAHCFGLALDGFGYGWDKKLRGGELFFIDRLNSNDELFKSIGEISPILLPGGDKSAKEPWRLGISLIEYFRELHVFDDTVFKLFTQIWEKRDQHPLIVQMLNKKINCPSTTSLGRWFDAIAGLLGVCSIQTYEGEAAMCLETLAVEHLRSPRKHDSFEQSLRNKLDGFDVGCDLIKNIQQDDKFDVNLYAITSTLIHNYVRDRSIKQFALDFHIYVAKYLARCLIDAKKRYTDVEHVVLSGGCIQNRLMTEALIIELKKSNFHVDIPKNIPVNDGGVSVGQLVYSLKYLSAAVGRPEIK